VLSSLTWAFYVIWREYDHRKEFPVLTTVGSPNQPVSKFRFPAVTVCPGKAKVGPITSLPPFQRNNFVHDSIWIYSEHIAASDVDLRLEQGWI